MATENTRTSTQESVVQPTNENTTECNSGDDVEVEESPYEPKKRKRTSKVWRGFKEVTDKNGEKKVQCIYCKKNLSINKSSSTSHLGRHLRLCIFAKKQTDKGQQNLSVSMSVSQLEIINSVQNFKYDQAKIREVLSHMVIVHELPFQFAEYELFNLLMRTSTPHYEKIGRRTVKNDCTTSFELEKKKLMAELKEVDRMSVTTDLWKSGQNVSYMVVTCHYVDSEWNLQKRTLNFRDIPPPHTWIVISDVLHKCLVEWGIDKKVWTVIVDNATNNDIAIRTLKENLSYNHTLPLDGKIFHVRCCAHILNILVQYGLTAIQDIISKVRDSVKFVAASEARTNMFSDIVRQLELSSKKLVLDCCTRWNATYFMLSAALEFKDVFPRYQQRDPLYTTLPTEEDWKRVQVVCSFLQQFHELTKLISGSEYPTANLFLIELVKIKKLLKNETQDKSMKEMIEKMKKKFEKYWGSCNLLISIAAILDPRNKMRIIKWYTQGILSEADGVVLTVTVRETLRHLYDEYVEKSIVNVAGTSTVEPLREELSINVPLDQVSRHDFESFISDDDCVTENYVLDLYLEEPVVKWRETTSFDAIMWWKMNNSKYKTLSRMACDVLSISITTVASESAFSVGGRVIDPHRASLSVNTVNMLLCTADWLRSRYNIKGKARDKEDTEDKEDREIEEINLT